MWMCGINRRHVWALKCSDHYCKTIDSERSCYFPQTQILTFLFFKAYVLWMNVLRFHCQLVGSRRVILPAAGKKLLGSQLQICVYRKLTSLHHHLQKILAVVSPALHLWSDPPQFQFHIKDVLQCSVFGLCVFKFDNKNCRKKPYSLCVNIL